MSSNVRTAIVMSRLPRLAIPDAPWLCGMRAALRRVSDRGDTLLVGEGTAGCDFVRRGAELLGLGWEVVSSSDGRAAHVEVAVSDRDGIPGRDRRLADAADELLVLAVRDHGHWHRLLIDRLRTGRGGVTLVDLSELDGSAARDELLLLGASLWKPDVVQTLPFPGPPVETAAEGMEQQAQQIDAIVELVPFPGADNWVYLSHTTRACPGHWPGQTLDEYLDSLLQSRSDADHAPVGTLERILLQRRLIASMRTARGGGRIVSFTASPLSRLPELRRFRRHRGRWDFEPFGLCIRQEWLMHRGARPVLYGDETAWQNLSESDRPFFQPAHSGSSTSEDADSGIDWTVEREWRHVGDLDLSQLSREDALVFVPNFAAARRLSAVSPWPITLWPDPTIELVGGIQRVQGEET
ncbi:MAG: hypothetical protein AABP62_17965 [Planctomycetota bacterium]